MKKTIKKSYLFIVMLTFMIVLFSSMIVSTLVSPNKAFALSNLSAAIQVGGGAELWDSSTQSFDTDVVKDLKEKLFGNKNPIKYIQSRKDPYLDTYLMSAAEINKTIKNDNGLIVTLDEKEWMVAALSLADIENKKDNVILTLYLANSLGTSKFYSSASNTKWSNAYSTSLIRQHLQTDTNWSLYNDKSVNSFASQFLVQPKYIDYQLYQTNAIRSLYSYVFPNESLISPSKGWHVSGIKYETDDINNGVRYDDWGNDYIWLPSMTEVGTNDLYDNGASSIWQLSDNQRAISGSKAFWTRSGHSNHYGNAVSIAASGLDNGGQSREVTTTYAVRPAIHLNLSEIFGRDIRLNNPEDIEVTFNDKDQTIKSLATATKADWYNQDIYEHADNYINITYSNGATGIKDAGEYWVKLEITSTWVNAVKTQIANLGVQRGWTAEQITAMQELQKPKFFGTPDTSDANHKESDTVRWIKITINKAEIDFSKVTWSQSEFEYNGQIQSVKITSGLPSFLTAVYDNNAKSAVGEYTASVINFTGSDPNYKTYTSAELANIPQLKHNWKITKKKVAVSWTKKNVTIGEITLPIPRLQVAENLANAIEYKYFRKSDLTDEVTLEQIFAENDISEIKSYYIQAIFTTNTIGFNNSNCIFVVDGNEENSVSEVFQTGSVINKVEVSLKNNKFTYNGLAQEVELNVVGGGLTASNLVISYTTADGTPLSGAPTNVGRYKVLVGLQSGLDDFMIVGENTFDYEIESLKIRKPKADQVNIFDAEGFGLSAVANMPTNWKSYFEITVDGNVVDESYKFTKAGKYSIQIAFKNGVNTANGGEVDNVVWEDRDNTTYTITLDIQTLEFEISGWQNGTGNKRPTILSDEKSEIEKYFDYEIYQVKDGQIIGNVILPTATLKYDTNYQISLKVKNEYKGSVFLKYNGELVDETETYSFKTEVNPNPSGGDGEDDNNGTDGKPNGGSNGGGFGGLINGKMSLLDWILIGIVCFMALLILLMFVLNIKLNKNIKNLKLFREQVSPVNDKNNKDNSEEISDNSQANASVINPYTVKNSDWTFVIKEKDVVNIDLLNAPTDKIMFYAFKEADAKGIKKFQSQLMENIKENQAEQIGDNHSKDSKKSKSKKDNKKQPK